MESTDISDPIRILLVEDNPHDRRIFQRAFRKSAIPTQITVCRRGEEALDLLADNQAPYDLVVSDHGLPGISGLDLFRELKDKGSPLPFVLLTGVGNELLAVSALKLGVDDYLPKSAGQAYIEQLPAAIGRVHRFYQDRIQKARIEAELKERELKEQFLSQATTTALLAAMEDYGTTTDKLAQLAVPFFADWCLVVLFGVNGTPAQAASTHADPDKKQLVDEFLRAITAAEDPAPVAAEAMQQRRPKLLPDILNPRDLLGTCSSDVADSVAQLNPQSLICVPLLIRDRTIGIMWLFYSDSGRTYQECDLSFAEKLGQRAAIAIENARIYAAVREKDRLKDEFLALLSHELRNPLAPVRNAMEILRKRDANSPLVEKAMATMERQLEQMIRLVDDLLDLSRVMRGKIRLRRKPVTLDAIIERALEIAIPIIEARRHELIVNLPESDVWLEVDEIRIAQVLANLLNNAAKYTDEAGHIWLDGAVEDNELLVRVRDDGIGMEAYVQAHVFDLFQQVESSFDRSQGGLGIGLTLVRRLTEMHHGSVSAYSDGLGRGSEFTVLLPVLRVEQQKDAKTPIAQPRAETRIRSLRILVVDDNVDAAEMLSELLRLDGHQVHIAHDGPSALAIAKPLDPEAILLDIGLPGMSGYEVAEHLRQIEQFSETLLIAVTGFGQESDTQRSRRAGFDYHFVKPVPLHSIRDVLSLRGDRRQPSS